MTSYRREDYVSYRIDRALGKHYSDLFEKRHKGDYNDFIDYDEETVLRLFPNSKILISKIESLIQNDDKLTTNN